MATLVLDEDTRPNPRSLYAIGKYTSELLTRRYGELHGSERQRASRRAVHGPMERVTGHRANQSLLKEWTGNVVSYLIL